jgi:hypothetical protein
VAPQPQAFCFLSRATIRQLPGFDASISRRVPKKQLPGSDVPVSDQLLNPVFWILSFFRRRRNTAVSGKGKCREMEASKPGSSLAPAFPRAGNKKDGSEKSPRLF